MRSVLLAGLLCSGCAPMAEDQWTGRDKANILSPLQSWLLQAVNMGSASTFLTGKARLSASCFH